MPREVFEEFESNFYGGCTEPPFDRLRIVRSWSGTGPENLRFAPPDGTYFLVLVGSPNGSDWRFDSTKESSSGRKYQSLHIESSVPDHVTDAQEWCTQGSGVKVPNILEIESVDVLWTVYLIDDGPGEELPRDVQTALTGYYGICPPTPPVDTLQAEVIGRSSETGPGDVIAFTGKPSHYFLGVQFQPVEAEWYFRSVDVRGDWRAEGPRVESGTQSTIDFSAVCPSSPSSHHLEVEWAGGDWVLYLITVSGED